VRRAQAYVVEDLADQLAREGTDPTSLSGVVRALREAQASVEVTLAVLDQVAPAVAEQP
jgi:hypothetical protein